MNLDLGAARKSPDTSASCLLRHVEPCRLLVCLVFPFPPLSPSRFLLFPLHLPHPSPLQTSLCLCIGLSAVLHESHRTHLQVALAPSRDPLVPPDLHSLRYPASFLLFPRRSSSSVGRWMPPSSLSLRRLAGRDVTLPGAWVSRPMFALRTSTLSLDKLAAKHPHLSHHTRRSARRPRTCRTEKDARKNHLVPRTMHLTSR
mmetsp:Transcript_10856/g.36572  ORF Transcript_10856/g.36572 Transcript_10856/m.36572 type:complete len:201 (+) Transcript_10856:163-765(+)